MNLPQQNISKIFFKNKKHNAEQLLGLLSLIKYEKYGDNMVGIFHSKKGYFMHFNNAS